MLHVRSFPRVWQGPYLGHSVETGAESLLLSPSLNLEGRKYSNKQSICYDITPAPAREKHLVQIIGLLLWIVGFETL